MPTQKDIARVLSVSESLVSKVLSGKGETWASSGLCERIHRTAAELSYRPNAAGQALARGRTGLVALWSTTIESFARYNSQIGASARADGFELLVRNLEYTPADWIWPVDGIICLFAEHKVSRFLREAGKTRAPIINLSSEECEGVDSIVIDLTTGIREAMAGYLARGCRRIAYFLPRGAALETDSRWRAYHQAMAAASLSPEIIVSSEMSSPAAYVALNEHFVNHPPPDALLVFASCMVPGALAALDKANAPVPRNVSLVTIDNTPELEFLRPPISAIEAPIVQACHEGWRLLSRRMAHPDRPLERAILPTTLVRRESSGAI